MAFKHALGSVFLALLMCCALAGPASRKLEMSASVSTTSGATSMGNGSASASSSTRSTGGRATASSFASTQTIEEAGAEVITILNTIEGNVTAENCEDIIDEIITAMEFEGVTAVASVLTEAFSSATVEGEGEACATSEASGGATATSFIDVLVKNVVDFVFESNPNSNQASTFAEALVNVISEVTVTAFADAFTSACTTGGSAEAIQTSIAEAISKPLVAVYAAAFGGIDCAEDAITSLSDSEVAGISGTTGDMVTAESFGSSTTEGDSDARTGGGAGATIDVAEEAEEAIETTMCRSEFSVCCTTFVTGDTCRCVLSSSARALCNAERIADNIWFDEEKNVRCRCRESAFGG